MTDEEIKAVIAGVPDEVACADELVRLRWPEGFRCTCGCTEAGRIASRPRVLQCLRCRRQQSVTAGTALEGVKVPLRLCFAAARCLAAPTGVAAFAFARVAEIRHETAWRLLHRLRHALDERDPFARGMGPVELARVRVQTRADGFDRESRAGRSGWDETAFVALCDRDIVHVARKDSELGAVAEQEELPSGCPRCGPRRRLPAKVREAQARLHRSLHVVHGGVGRRWLDNYLREHEFRANRPRGPALAGSILGRALEREPARFRDMKGALTPVRPGSPLPAPAVPCLPHRLGGTAPRFLRRARSP